MATSLTDSQRRITRAPRELTDDAGDPPSIREVADAVGLSATTPAYHCRPWNAARSSPTPRTAAAHTGCAEAAHNGCADTTQT
ncbi:hypothetical protein [Streptomyces sioyaensis]